MEVYFSNLTSSGTHLISKKKCSGPDGPRRLVFKTVRIHDIYFGGFNRLLKYFKNHAVPLGFASKSHVNFRVVLEGGSGGGGGSWRNGGPIMQGRQYCRPFYGKARAMACGGNPRALPDFSDIFWRMGNDRIFYFLSLYLSPYDYLDANSIERYK